MAKLGLGVNGIVIRAHYELCRHPIMTGFFMMFTFVPEMTYNHLFFSISCIVYILIAVKFFEEPQLLEEFVEYKDYMETTPTYCPFTNCCCLRKRKKESDY